MIRETGNVYQKLKSINNEMSKIRSLLVMLINAKVLRAFSAYQID